MSTSDALLSLFARKPAAAELTPEEELQLRGQQSSLLSALTEQKSPYENTLEMSLAAALPALGTALAGGGSMGALGYGAAAGARGVEGYTELMKAQQEKDRTASLLELSNIQNRLDAASMYRSEQAKNKALLERAKATTGLGQLLEAGGTKEDFLAQKDAQAGLTAARTQQALRPPSSAAAKEDELISDLEKQFLANTVEASAKNKSPEEQKQAQELANQIRGANITRGAQGFILDTVKVGGSLRAQDSLAADRTQRTAQAKERLNLATAKSEREAKYNETRVKLNELKIELAKETNPNKVRELETKIALSEDKLRRETGPPNAAQIAAIEGWNNENPNNTIEMPEGFTFGDAKDAVSTIEKENKRVIEEAKLEANKNKAKTATAKLDSETTSTTQPSIYQFATTKNVGEVSEGWKPTKGDRVKADEATSAYRSLKPKIEELQAFLRRNNNNIPTSAGTKEFGEFSRITSSIINDIRKLQNLGANFTKMEETNVWQQAIGGQGNIDPDKLWNYLVNLKTEAQNRGGIDFLANANAFARSIERGYVNGMLGHKFLPPAKSGIRIDDNTIMSLNVPDKIKKEIWLEYGFKPKKK